MSWAIQPDLFLFPMRQSLEQAQSALAVFLETHFHSITIQQNGFKQSFEVAFDSLSELLQLLRG